MLAAIRRASSLVSSAADCYGRSQQNKGRSSTDLTRYPQAFARLSDKVNFRDRHHIRRTRTKTQIEVYRKKTVSTRFAFRHIQTVPGHVSIGRFRAHAALSRTRLGI